MSAEDDAVVEVVEEKDDRWSGFVDPVSSGTFGAKKQREPVPDLSEFLGKVLKQKSPRDRQEKQYKVAAKVVRMVCNVAYVMNAEWKMYISSDAAKNAAKTMPLRTLSEDSYECMIPLIRPMRLDGFKVAQKGKDEMLPYRCLIQVNPALCREEARLVYNEWTPYINRQGFLRPRSLLKWFNSGLGKACAVVFKDNHNIDLLTCTESEDGTAIIHVTATEYDGSELEINNFKLNVFPVYVMDTLPSSVKLGAPLPCFGAYIHGQKEFRDLVIKDLELGKHVAVLDPKAELGTAVLKNAKPEVDKITWKINLSFTEYHVYSLIDKYCRGLNFRHVLVLFNILREEYRDQFAVLNNDILVNTLFNVSQRHIDKLFSTGDWFYKVSQALCEGLQANFLPSFYLPRQNLLRCYNVSDAERKAALDKLDEMYKTIKQNPRSLYDYARYEDKKKGKDSDDSDSDDENANDENDDDDNKDDENDDEDDKDNEDKISNTNEHAVETVSVNDEVREPFIPTHNVIMEEDEAEVSVRKGDRSDIY